MCSSDLDTCSDGPIVCVITSEADAGRAQRLASSLVEQRLAGCVSLLPMSSIYIWEGQVEHSSEVQLLIKTTAHRLEALHEAVMSLHSYDTPMWVQWPAQADRAYGRWLAQVTDHQGASPPARED